MNAQEIPYTQGEIQALIAPILGCQPDDLQGVVVIGMPASVDEGSLPLFTDAPSSIDAIALMLRASSLLLMESDPRIRE